MAGIFTGLKDEEERSTLAQVYLCFLRRRKRHNSQGDKKFVTGMAVAGKCRGNIFGDKGGGNLHRKKFRNGM